MARDVISHFKGKPKTRTGWLALWLGLATLLIGPVIGGGLEILRPVIDPESVNPNRGIAPGFAGGIFGLILAITTIILGVRAYLKGERS